MMSKTFSLLLDDLISMANRGPLPAKIIEQYKTKLIQVAREGKLNKKQCAAVLGVSPRTLDYWVKDWGLPVRYRQGPNTKKRPAPYFELDEVLTWHESHRINLRSDWGDISLTWPDRGDDHTTQKL